MADLIFRIHPTINFARVGTSGEYYVAPETAAGEIVDAKTGVFGGLPIKAGTEDTFIEAKDLRDDQQRPKRQAARYRILVYDESQQSYPSQAGREIKIGDKIGDRTIKDIVWTLHLANKKANNYMIADHGEEKGIASYENGQTPPIRNPSFGSVLSETSRLKELQIDAGPRALASSSDGKETVAFDASTTCRYGTPSGGIETAADYPVSFPDDHLQMLNPQGPIDTLGELTIEKNTGRLLVLGGYGRADAILTNGKPPPLEDPRFDRVRS